ncbi:unnamed protein product [Effrenium voratum]|uniref:non-specific serine/threonine protein kinase n=1 Tax=Effrenium voratum TaxID=2562239 RepID=A0AA36HLQ0_9DINO|nr:unnamed protein product [Effrenium voratum]
MLGDDLMETTSLQDAVEKMMSDVASTSNAGLDALREWLQDQRNLDKADSDPKVWPAVLKVLVAHSQRQVQSLTKAGGRKVSFRVDGPATLLAAVKAARRKRRVSLAKVAMRVWIHIEEVLRNEVMVNRQTESLFYYCKAAQELSEAADQGALLELRPKRVLKPLLEVQGSQRTKGAALDAAANLCRHAEGDIAAEVAMLCERSLAMFSCGQPAASCLAACALRAPFAFRDWLLTGDNTNTLVGALTSAWPALRQCIDQLDLVLRLVLSLLPSPPKAAQLVPLCADTLEAEVRSDSSSLCFAADSGERFANARRTARLADLMASLLWSSAAAAEVAREVCGQLDRRCLPWALCLVRLCERQPELAADSALLAQLCGAVLRQLQKGVRLEMELPALQGALLALLEAWAWHRLGWHSGDDALPLWCSQLTEARCSITSSGIVELLPALDVKEAPELAAQLHAISDYVKQALASNQTSANFWPLLSVVFLLAPDRVRDLQEELLTRNRFSSASLFGQHLTVDVQKRLLEGLLNEPLEQQLSFLWLSSGPRSDAQDRRDTAEEWPVEFDDFFLSVPRRETVPSHCAAWAARKRRSACACLETELQRRLAAAALNEEARPSFSACGSGPDMDEVLLERTLRACALVPAEVPVRGRSLQLSERPEGAAAFAAAWGIFESRYTEFKNTLSPTREVDLGQSLRCVQPLLPAFTLALWLPQSSGGQQRMLTECFRRLLQFANTVAICSAEALRAAKGPTPEAFFSAFCGVVWQVAGALTSSDFSSLVATLADNLTSRDAVGAAAAKLQLLIALAVQDCQQPLRQHLLQLAKEDEAAALSAIRLAAAELCWHLENQSTLRRCDMPGLAATVNVLGEVWCACPSPVSALDWEAFLGAAQRLLRCRPELTARTWPANALSRLEAQTQALGDKWWPNARTKMALASVLTQSLRLFNSLGMTDQVQIVANCCMGAVPDFILKDTSCEVQLEVASSCMPVLFEAFDNTTVFQEFSPMLEALSSESMAPGLPSSALVAFQVALAMAKSGLAHQVLPRVCTVPSGLRPTARRVLSLLEEEPSGGLSPLALAFRAPIFLRVLRARGRLTQLPLMDLGLNPEMPSLPGRGQRWGLGRHLAAAVVAMVLAEDFGQLGDLAPCCGLGAASGEFLELVAVPLAGALVPLRKSLQVLQEKLGDKVLPLLQRKASHIFAFALQLPLLTCGDVCQVDAEAVATAFREVAPQVEWADTGKFVASHFRELIFLLDPVIRAWAPHTPQAAVEVLRAFGAWAGPLSASRLRLWAALLLQHSKAVKPKQRQELGALLSRAITTASPGAIGRLARQRDETVRLMLAEVEAEWGVSGEGAERSTERSVCLTGLAALLKALKASGKEEPWLQLQLEAIMPRLAPPAQQLLDDALGASSGSASAEPAAKRLRKGASSRLGAEVALKQLAPPPPALAWGPAPAPDLGCIVQSLASSAGSAPEDVMYSTLRLVTQAQPLQQLRGSASLARMLALGLAALGPVAAVQVQCEEFLDPLEAALQGAKANAEELLYSVVLLGCTQLQAHPYASVRQLAGQALRQLIQQQKPLCQAARKLLQQILDKQHLFLEDMDDLLSSSLCTLAPRTSARTGSKISWQFLRQEKDLSVWMSGLLSNLQELGPCVALAQKAPWFAQQLLGLGLVKAANGQNLAKDMNLFFQQSAPDPAQAQCLLRALHLIRMHQTTCKKRAVPHFPSDSGDQFWSALDLRAAAECAAKYDPQHAFLLLELHLQRAHPEVPPCQSLQTAKVTGVEALFQAPQQEVRLLHDLARQLPEDELLYGNAQWCHSSSRLARAELDQDHLLSIHLRNELLESLQGNEALAARQKLDDALANLGWHALTAETAAGSGGEDVWERRCEALWRMRQWGPVEGKHQGFHATLHTALSGLSSAVDGVSASANAANQVLSEAASKDMSQAVGALERPLLKLVSAVTGSAAGSGASGAAAGLTSAALRLQMLGSVFQCCDALVADVQKMSQAASASRAVATLAASWQKVPKEDAATHFQKIEPLLALQSSILATTQHALPELRFLTSMAQVARSQQPHRALTLLERALRAKKSAKPQRQDLLKLHWEQACCLWDLKQPQEALSIAQAVAAECRGGAGAERAPDAWKAQVLSVTGRWLALSRLEGPELIQKEYFEPANVLDASTGRDFAEFLDRRLTEEVLRQGSAQHLHTKEARRKTEAALKRAGSEVERLQKNAGAEQDSRFRTLRDEKNKLEKRSNEDRKTAQQEAERIEVLATGCVRQLGRCLMESGSNLTRVACRFLSLWFDHNVEVPEVTKIVRESIPKLQLPPVMPFIYQLASRLDTAKDQPGESQEAPFQQALDEFLLRLAQKLGAVAMWPLISLRNGDQVPKDMQGSAGHVADRSKLMAASRVIEKIRKLPMRSVLEAVEVLNKFYLDIALFKVDKRNREVEVPLTSLPHFREVRKVLQSTHVPVPTVASSDVMPKISSFGETFSIAKQGLSCPKIVRVVDSEGREHKQLVKGHDDLRQDAVMQQLFRLLNDVFKENPKSKHAQLGLRTFQVVPLSPCAGIAEWVANTATLADVLISDQQSAHPRYRPRDWSHMQCRKRMADAAEPTREGKVLEKALQEVYDNFKPVMHLVLLERFPGPQEWHRARQVYARSVAVSSIVGYIVGLGDRHPNNILMDQQTGELVHIDFGIAFDKGRALRIPELVPFRLTRDIVAGLGCLGTCGLFRKSAETAMEVLRSSAPLVTAVVEVFVHDPLYFWSLTPAKPRRDNQDVPGEAEGNEMAKRAVVEVKAKLGEGTDDVLGVPAHVGRLIHEAIDPANLSRMFAGWQGWV